MYDEKNQKVYKYSKKTIAQNVQYEMMLPENASGKFQSPAFFFNEIERAETRSNSQLIRELVIALPEFLNAEENKKITRRFAKRLVDDGMSLNLAYHKLEQHNPHCHISCGMREIDENTGLFKKSKNTERARGWNNQNNVSIWRKQWADTVNEYMEEKGMDYRVSEKSYEERGIELIPRMRYPENDKVRKAEVMEVNQKIKEANRVIKDGIKIKQIKEIRAITISEKYLESSKQKRLKVIRRNTAMANILEPRKNLILNEEEETKMALRDIGRDVMNQIKEDTQSVEQSQSQGNTASESLAEMYKRDVKRADMLLDSIKQGINTSKEVAKKLSHSLHEKRQKTIESRMKKRSRIKDLNLENKGLKLDIKSTKMFSIEGYEERKNLRLQIKRNKLSMQRNKIAIAREKEELKMEKKNLRKENINRFKLSLQYVIQDKKKQKDQKLFQRMGRSKDMSVGEIISKQNEKIKNQAASSDIKLIKQDKIVNFQEFKKAKIQMKLDSGNELNKNKQRSKGIQM